MAWTEPVAIWFVPASSPQSFDSRAPAANRQLRSPMVNLRAAIRPLLQHPGFTAVAVLTIAIGIGANASLFSVYDQLVLNPVSAPDPQTLVAIVTRNPQLNV